MKITTSLFQKFVGYQVLLIFLASCTPSATKSVNTDLKNPKPDWLNSKPPEDTYYVGIGHSNKDASTDYFQQAKKSALEDLVSEIKVTVSSSSVLSQMDANKSFQETYQKIIQTRAVDDIQEFEQVDSWQDDNNYWVYYRLSKQRYAEIKAAQKKDAVDKAIDFFTKAKQSESSRDFVQALGFYVQGFLAIEKYLAEPIQLDFGGTTILLTNEIYSNMQLLLDKIQLIANPAELTVNRRISESGINVIAKSIQKEVGKPIVGLPLSASFTKGSGDVYSNYNTNSTGEAKILISKINARDLEQTVNIKVDLMSFLANDSSAIATLVVGKLNLPSASILLKVQRPLVYITSVEKSFGIDRQNQQLSNQLSNFITNAGFEITPDKDRAQFLINLSADSEKGAVSGSIFIAYVSAVVKVIVAKDNKEIYATSLDRIKGYSLDYDRSSQEAYNKSLEILEKEKMPELLNSILQ